MSHSVRKGSARKATRAPAAKDRPARERQGIQSIETGSRLLDALAAAGTWTTLRDLAADAGMSASKAHRYLVSLMKCGLVSQDKATSRYNLGPAALRLGLAALSHRNVVRSAAEAAVDLNQRIDQTVILSVWSERGPVVVAWHDATEVVMCNVSVGSVFPLLRTATGRVFLAFLPRAATASFVERELGGVVSLIPQSRLRTMADVDRLITEVRIARIGMTQEEFLPGLSAIAAPIFDHQGRIEAAIAMIGVRGTVDHTGPGSMVEVLRATADAVSRELGFPDPRPGASFVERLEAGDHPGAFGAAARPRAAHLVETR
ncbi:MAG: IclR family transcriptional regulator [Alphaproteobacteria bacterium]|nr:IclR family transcriptional regulator [Alphaproteobacteria bacterium]